MKRFLLTFAVIVTTLFVLPARVVFADCSGPIGKEGDIVYNGDNHTYQFCNGLGWLGYGGGSACNPANGGNNPASSSGTGYFVITSTTYNGNLGGIIAANALCLTELTTNTGWMGYSTANSNGQLIATKVYAFLCEDDYQGGPCNNLMPLTTYDFANAGNGAAGGASFTTDANGNGPNDAANWSGATYFGASYAFWSQRNGSGTNIWPATSTVYGYGGRCSGFTTSSSGDSGVAGGTNSTGVGRWYNTAPTCDTSQHLVCFVNP